MVETLKFSLDTFEEELEATHTLVSVYILQSGDRVHLKPRLHCSGIVLIRCKVVTVQVYLHWKEETCYRLAGAVQRDILYKSNACNDSCPYPDREADCVRP